MRKIFSSELFTTAAPNIWNILSDYITIQQNFDKYNPFAPEPPRTTHADPHPFYCM